MGIDRASWRQRIAERSDLSSQVVHLVRRTESLTELDVLMSILREGRVRASDPRVGFINGGVPAACFQDAPLSGICQNVYFEQKYRKANPTARERYRAMGLMFPKESLYRAGGRPVIYDRPADAKQYLPKAEWWRIVNYDLSSDDSIVDWTHEREWRIPGDFNFELADATVLIVKGEFYTKFVKRAEAEIPGGMAALNGIVVLSNILY